jgi:spore germination protein
MRFLPSRRRTLQALGLLPFLAQRSSFATDTPIPRSVGYLPWWMAAAWNAVPWRALDRLLLFDVPVQADGSLLDRGWPNRARGLAPSAERAGVPIDLTLTLLDEQQFHAVFQDAAARSRLLADCLRLLEQPFVAGLHLDIEGYSEAHPDAVAGFRRWLEALDAGRRRSRKALSAFFPASDSFSPYDRAAAERIDYWVVQLYDAHWRDSKVTGPLVTRMPENPAAVPRALARLEALGAARHTVLLSVPLYGWQWPSDADGPGAPALGRAKLLTFAETPKALMPEDRLAASDLAQRHGLRRDGEHSPYFAYREGAHWVQGWFEDLESLKLKLAPERARDYAGLAFFPLGYDKGEIVEAMLRWWHAAR